MFLSIGKTAKLFGVTTNTLRNWDRNDDFCSSFRTIGNHRRYDFQSIREYLGEEIKDSQPVVVVYARVSASKQKEDLKRQIASLENFVGERGWKLDRIYQDIASDR